MNAASQDVFLLGGLTMVNHKEIFHLKSLELTNREIATATGYGRNTVTRTLARVREQRLSWEQARSISQQKVSRKLFPEEQKGPVYKMPDCKSAHHEMQKGSVTLCLLWVEYCEQSHQNSDLAYKSTQFNKCYANYVRKTKSTMHLRIQASEHMQVDWAGQTAFLVDTGEQLATYLFVAVLPYIGYAYADAFLDMKKRPGLSPTGGF